MGGKQNDKTQIVYTQVSTDLEEQEARELWHQLKSELTRQEGGPDACSAYLEGELTRMKEQVQRTLDWVGKV